MMVFLFLKEGYPKKIIERFVLKESKRCSTPLIANMKIRREKKESSFGSSTLSGLIYLTITRPAIIFVVGVTSRYMQFPCKPHL